MIRRQIFLGGWSIAGGASMMGLRSGWVRWKIVFRWRDIRRLWSALVDGSQSQL